MTKPLTIARREFVEAMDRLIAHSGLPFSMLSDIFRDAAAHCQQMENEQYERDKIAYEESLKQHKKCE